MASWFRPVSQVSAMSYAKIDSTIRAWTEKHRLTLFNGIEGMDHSLRCVYISSEKGECFQIWVGQPESGQVSIHAADVETHLDETLRQDWSVSVENLEAALENALARVQSWMNR